jgi:hypothetical protein
MKILSCAWHCGRRQTPRAPTKVETGASGPGRLYRYLAIVASATCCTAMKVGCEGGNVVHKPARSSNHARGGRRVSICCESLQQIAFTKTTLSEFCLHGTDSPARHRLNCAHAGLHRPKMPLTPQLIRVYPVGDRWKQVLILDGEFGSHAMENSDATTPQFDQPAVRRRLHPACGSRDQR